MKANFDEISIQYWLDNRKYIQAKWKKKIFKHSDTVNAQKLR